MKVHHADETIWKTAGSSAQESKVSPFFLKTNKQKNKQVNISAKKQKRVRNSQIGEKNLEETYIWATKKSFFKFLCPHNAGVLYHTQEDCKTPVCWSVWQCWSSLYPLLSPRAGLVQRAEKQSSQIFPLIWRGWGSPLVLEAAFGLNVVKNLL